MLSKILTIILFFVAIIHIAAQNNDSLFVVFNDGNWQVPHKVLPGENAASIGHTFHVPISMLADMNGITAKSTTINKSNIDIPIGEYNLLKSKPAKQVSARALYYKCKRGDNIYRVGNRSGVPQNILKDWNNLLGNNFYEGQVLLIGWVLCEPNRTITKQTPPMNGKTKTIPADTLANTEAVRQYLLQTSNESNVAEEKGPAVFYDAVGKATGPYYAFYNGASRGSIIKVFNPGNGKTIYVKVMGKLPETKQYYNCIIGISGTAKAALGVTESRTWCELKFSSR